MLAVGADAAERIQRFRTLRLIEALLHQLSVAEDGGKRRSQLVTHVSDKLRLVLARNFKLVALSPDFFKKTRVLDGDDGLIGEGSQQFNLSLCKWSHLGATQSDCPDRFTNHKKWNGQDGVETQILGDRTSLWILAYLGLRIGNVNRLLVKDCTPDDSSTGEGQSGIGTERPNMSAVRNYAENVAVLLQDPRVVGIAETRR